MTSVAAVQPTFLQFNKVAKDDSWKQSSVYGYSVTFAGGNFFTNSVFADTYAEHGTWGGWLYTIVAYGFAGYAFARIFSFSPPVIAASAGVVGYCFLEVWRVQILIYGIVIFLLLITAASAVTASRLRPPSGLIDPHTQPVDGELPGVHGVEGGHRLRVADRDVRQGDVAGVADPDPRRCRPSRDRRDGAVLQAQAAHLAFGDRLGPHRPVVATVEFRAVDCDIEVGEAPIAGRPPRSRQQVNSRVAVGRNDPL